jgi:LysM repeat protein
MGYWGWRPLLCGVFISAWVVSCDIVPDNTDPSAAAPSSYPSVTLTVGRLPTIGLSPPTPAAPTNVVTAEPPAATSEPLSYVIQPGDTLAEIATRFNLSIEAIQDANARITTLEAGENLLIPRPTPLPLDVQAPTCYETTPGNLLCLGRVDNPLDFAVESVTVEVSLIQADGTIALRRSTVEQMLIPAGSFAPYQASFAASDFNNVNARMVSAAEAADAENVVLLVQDIEGQVLDGRVIISAMITNPEAGKVELLRAFITLLDNQGSVIGYRVLMFETGTILDGGEQFPLQIEMTPQVSDVTPEYNVYVEARNVP